MSITVEIPVDDYRILLTLEDRHVLHAASQSDEVDEVRGKGGEALFAALLLAVCKKSKGEDVRVERYRNGKLNDGPRGEPAVREFSGTWLRREERYRNGKLNDGPRGELAVQVYGSGGGRDLAQRYKNGRLVHTLNDQEKYDYSYWVAEEHDLRAVQRAIPGLTMR